eukprot:SAG31_NODE_27822_length_419_cov_1.268750_1_plen_34_part_00
MQGSEVFLEVYKGMTHGFMLGDGPAGLGYVIYD